MKEMSIILVAFSFLMITFWVGIELGYNDGQQDALLGKQKFQIRTNDTIEFIYK